MLEPLRVLLRDKLQTSGTEWEEGQLQRAAESVLAGGPPRREYRLSLAAANTLEFRFLDQVRMLLTTPTMWVDVPRNSLTFTLNCLTYRMLARMACYITQNLISVHAQFPICLFGLLVESDRFADYIGKLPECMRCSWSQAFLRDYGLACSPESLAVLVLIAHMAFVDIAGIEARHASIRRWLLSRSG